MNKIKKYEFHCPECQLDHVEHGSLISSEVEHCHVCLRNGKKISLHKKLPADEVEGYVLAAQCELLRELREAGLDESVEDAIKAAVYRGFSSVIEACAESLAHVQNENELTGSDVVWVELENAQEAVIALKSAMSQK
tara:strand:+ start:1305 stop:1715 length:411 start_codon:yes stop_codon:yes gene_type:complete